MEVIDTITRAGKGSSFTEKLRDVAARIGAGERTLFRYQESGAKKGAANTLLLQLAYEHDVLPRPDDGGGVAVL